GHREPRDGPGSNDMKLVRYSDSSHNVDIDDGRSTTGHVFYLGTSPVTCCVSSNLAKGGIGGSDRE
ncbi:hypothetical protein Tco_0476538, partial [Tanacetum coccineum]